MKGRIYVPSPSVVVTAYITEPYVLLARRSALFIWMTKFQVNTYVAAMMQSCKTYMLITGADTVVHVGPASLALLLYITSTGILLLVVVFNGQYDVLSPYFKQ